MHSLAVFDTCLGCPIGRNHFNSNQLVAIMSRIRFLSTTAARALLAGVVLSLAPLGLFAGESALEPEAKQTLKKSMNYLAGIQQFGLVAHSSLEVVLTTGQKIQFDSASAVAVKRPNLLYAARLGELTDQEFFYDGKTLTLHQADAGFYATVEAPDTLEGMLDFARESLDIVAPAGDFIYANSYEILMEGVESGFVVGPSFVNGVACDHLAFSKPGTDFQIWVAQGEQPLPVKLVITSTDVMSAPQFTVNVREWDIVVDHPQEKFQFEQPDDAQAIEFTTLDAGGK